MYTIEKKYNNTNSMTVAQAQAYYGKLRVVTNIFDHWWGWPQNRAKSPDGIYDYMVRANKSVYFILGWDDYQNKIRIIALTPPDRVALTQQNGNIYGMGIEVDPLITTNDPRAYDLYKALGWLHTHIEGLVKRGELPPLLHKDVWATACSDIDKARVSRERNKWVSGAYDPKKPAPAGADIEYVPYDSPKLYITKGVTQLWEFNHTKHADMKPSLAVPLKAGTPVTIVGHAINKSVGGSKYLMTEYSFGETKNFDGKVNKTTGFNAVDMTQKITPTAPDPNPPKPTVPETPVTPAPAEPPKEVEQPDSDKEILDQVKNNNALLQELLTLVKSLTSWLKGIFK